MEVQVFVKEKLQVNVDVQYFQLMFQLQLQDLLQQYLVNVLMEIKYVYQNVNVQKGIMNVKMEYGLKNQYQV